MTTRQTAEGALVGKVFTAASGYTPVKGDEVELTGVLEVKKPTVAGSKKIVGEVISIPPGCGVGKCVVELRGQKVRSMTAGGAITVGDHVKRNSTGAKVLKLVTSGAAAPILTGVVGNNNALSFTTPKTGANANLVTFELRDPAAASQSLLVTRKGFHVDIALKTGAGPGNVIESTAAEIKAAIEANAEASKLLLVAHQPLSSGAGVVAAVSTLNCSFTAVEADDPLCNVGLALETAAQDGDVIEVLEQ